MRCDNCGREIGIAYVEMALKMTFNGFGVSSYTKHQVTENWCVACAMTAQGEKPVELRNQSRVSQFRQSLNRLKVKILFKIYGGDMG